MSFYRFLYVIMMHTTLMAGPSMASQRPRWARWAGWQTLSKAMSRNPTLSRIVVVRKTRLYLHPENQCLQPVNQANAYPGQAELAHPVVRCSYDVSHSRTVTTLQALRAGGVGQVLDIDELVGDAHDWCNNLGAPAALVAGAVIATLYENFRGGQLELHQGDTPYIQVAKKLTNMLLLSAFAMQIVSIFVTTVMCGVLRSYDFSSTTSTATSGLAFLQEHYEFEFLTSRLSFLQGLINWLAGVAIEYTIPRKGEGQAAKKMDHFIAISLATLIVLLLSFYNSHLTFYPNYFQMLLRWIHVTAIKYFETFQPLMILYIPGILLSCYAGFLALREGAYSEERDD